MSRRGTGAEGWRVRKDGSRFWADLVITAVRDEASRVIGFAKVTRDLTERKLAEERLAEEEARRLAAEQAAHFAKLFVGILGHDLRNPLNAMMTGASYLSRIATDEKQSRTIARILTSGNRMARMIDQLLDVTRIGIGGGIPLERRPLVLADVAQSIVDELDPVDANARFDSTSSVTPRACGIPIAWDKPCRTSSRTRCNMARMTNHACRSESTDAGTCRCS